MTMDPQATINEIENAIRNADIGRAVELVGVYYQWRLKGGFEPRNGDARVATLVARLAGIAE
jgi:hypothetical protein